MTIDEAIKILTNWKEVGESEDSYLLDEAEKLGIEALKRWKLLRTKFIPIPDPLLPGETE